MGEVGKNQKMPYPQCGRSTKTYARGNNDAPRSLVRPNAQIVVVRRVCPHGIGWGLCNPPKKNLCFEKQIQQALMLKAFEGPPVDKGTGLRSPWRPRLHVAFSHSGDPQEGRGSVTTSNFVPHLGRIPNCSEVTPPPLPAKVSPEGPSSQTQTFPGFPPPKKEASG